MTIRLALLGLLTALGLCACAGDSERSNASAENGGKAGAAGSGGEAGTASEEGGSAGAAGASEEGGSAGAAGAPSADTFHGFTLREPATATVTCSSGISSDPAELFDEDYVCTFEHEGVSGYVYSQATPLDCTFLMSAVPTDFDTTVLMTLDEKQLTPLENAVYSHGGNHMNNTLEFDFGDYHYRLAHSSIGFGGRTCQPPDCIQVYELDATTLVDDGCTVDRTLPITCAAVETVEPPPSLDTVFAPCPGDPNYP
jgi:hypothetical protein